MSAQTLERITVTSLIHQIEETCGLDAWNEIGRIVASLPNEVLVDLVENHVRGMIADYKRAATRAAERSAEEAARQREALDDMAERARLTAAWDATPERQRVLARRKLRDAKKSEEHEARMDVLNQSILDAIEQFKTDLKIEWTNELLESRFTLPDGTSVAWGHATVTQHELRAAMFTNNALSNMEGAARHRKAIDDIESSGATCLSEVAARVAA